MDWKKAILLSIALIAISAAVSALALPASGTNLDVNINTIKDFNADKGGNYIGTGSTYVDINFNIRDGDYNGESSGGKDINFSIYLAAFSGDRNFSIAVDLNADQYCGGATYNGNGTLIDYNSADGAACGYRWTTMANYRDGNWLIDINAVTRNRVSNDTNETDFNSSGVTFFLDRTTATPSISSPAGGFQSNGVPVAMTYTATDVNSGVRKYWIMLNGVAFADNGTAVSYTFPTQTNYQTIGILYNDFADNNSAETSISVNFSPRSSGETCGNGICAASETATTCPNDCSSVCGDEVCTGTESNSTCPADCGPGVACGDEICSTGENSDTCPADCEAPPQGETETIRELSSESGSPTEEVIADVLAEAGLGDDARQSATLASGITTVERSLQVDKTTVNGRTSYESTLSVKITNTSGKTLTNVKVIESIPKSVAASASDISSQFQFTVLKEDPVVEFTVGDMQPGESKEVEYTTNKNVSEASFNDYSQPVVSQATESEAPVDACAGVVCDDGNSCTSDSCDSGTCSNVPVPDGTACGLAKVCQAGNCVEQPAAPPVQPPAQAGGIDMTSIIIIVVIVGVIIGAWYYYSKKK